MGACTSRKIKFVPNDDIEGQVNGKSDSDVLSTKSSVVNLL